MIWYIAFSLSVVGCFVIFVSFLFPTFFPLVIFKVLFLCLKLKVLITGKYNNEKRSLNSKAFDELMKMDPMTAELLGDIPKARKRMADIGKLHAPRAGIIVHDKLATRSDGSVLNLKLIKPSGNVNNMVILYFHGGGYCIGGWCSYHSFLEYLCEVSRSTVLFVDYRLAPENKLPCAVEDAVLAYKWLLDQNIDEKNIVVAGDSAGGGLSLHLLVSLKQQKLKLPGAAVPISPWVNLGPPLPSYVENEGKDAVFGPNFVKIIGCFAKQATGLEDEEQRKDPTFSPLYADLSGLPPLYVIYGSNECLKDDSLELIEKVKSSGGKVDHLEGEYLGHVYPIFFNDVPEAREAVRKLVTWSLARTGN